MGVSTVLGLTFATLDLLAATARAWGPGALTGLGRTLSVSLIGAALAVAVGVLVGRWWTVTGAAATLGAAVALGVLWAADRDLAPGLWRRTS